jgi:nucleoside-diphosphate-sugar epimerase
VSKALVTGAFGNLGLMVIEEARSQGFTVVATDLDTARNRRHAHRLGLEHSTSWGDIRDLDLESALRGVDAVIHLAAVLPPATERSPDLAYAINVGAAIRLIDWLDRAAAPSVLVYPSSVTVYGPPTDRGRLHGSGDPTQATDNYSAHKLEVERRLARSTFPWVVLRVGVAVDSRTIGTDRATLRSLFAVHPDNPLEYVHPRDVARAMVNAARRPQAHGRTLPIGGGERCRVTQHEFLAAGLEALGLSLPREWLGEAGYYTCWLDTVESQALLDYQDHTFADYRAEMRERMHWPRRLLSPLRPAAQWALYRLLTR